MPERGDIVYGGQVKFALLNEELPNDPRTFNVLYLGSTSMPLEARVLVRLARRRGAAFVWNQNGVAYRGWYGHGWEDVNRPRARLLHAADHVFFQSSFCKVGSDAFYGERLGPWEVLHNPVDVALFVPAAARPRRPLTLLLAGSQYQRYSVSTSLEALAELRREDGDVRLVVTGSLSFAPDADVETHVLVRRLGLEDAVEFTGPYTRDVAPELYRRGDVLLHPKYNDPCPTAVLEAMAVGLPVVYSASGGTPELVGTDAGIGVPAPLDWERDHPPTPRELAAGVRSILQRFDDHATAARERAHSFDVRRWVARHREVFEELTRP